MTAGQLNRTISVERRSSGADGYGNTVSQWESLLTGEPAQIKPLKEGESVIAARLQGTGLSEIRVRYSDRTAEIKTDDRIVNSGDGRIYNIRSVANNDQRGRYLTILCEFGVADG